MQNEVINCWEFKKCGREPGGINVTELGICPVAVEHNLDGVHGGKNGGRCCWIFPVFFSFGTESTKNFDEKLEVCRSCDFYISVKDSEGVVVIL